MDITKVLTEYVESPNYTLEEELELIKLANSGDEEAYRQLLLAYAPLLKKALASIHKDADPEEARAIYLANFVNAMDSLRDDPTRGLGSVLPSYMKRAKAELSMSATGFSIPPRSLSRWLQITNMADGDIDRAAVIAPVHKMSRSNYLGLYKILRKSGSLDVLLEEVELDPTAYSVTHRPEVGELKSAPLKTIFEYYGNSDDLTTKEAKILSEYYLNNSTDSHVAKMLGISRQSVQRLRQSGLAKARRRFGLAA